MLGMNFNIPNLTQLRATEKIVLDQVENDIGYEIADRIFLKSNDTVAVGLPAEYLTGITIEFGQAAKSVAGVVMDHLADDLRSLTHRFWIPFCANLNGVDFAFAYIPLQSITDDKINDVVNWLNNRVMDSSSPNLNRLFVISNERSFFSNEYFHEVYAPPMNSVLYDGNLPLISTNDPIIRLTVDVGGSVEHFKLALNAIKEIPDAVLLLNFVVPPPNQWAGYRDRGALGWVSEYANYSATIQQDLASSQLKAVVWHGDCTPERLYFTARAVLDTGRSPATVLRQQRQY